MTEQEVVDAFCAWLQADGWITTQARGRNYCDVTATKDGATLYAEAKGTTSDPGTDADTMYGQLLRRMTTDVAARYAVVVPEGRALNPALRVSEPVRDLLRVEVYPVADDGTVRRA